MIRAARAGDLERILAIERASHLRPWTREHFASELDGSFWVIGDPVEAYIVCWLVAGELQVQNVTCAPEHRRKGHARALLTHTLASAKIATLEVAADNAAARRLYASLGFQEVGRRRGYYTSGEDAVLMTREETARG